MNWRHWVLIIVLVAGLPVAHADDVASSPEAQRFEVEKQKYQQHAFLACISEKNAVDRSWHAYRPPAHDKLLITKVKATLWASGKLSECKIITPSGSEQEDKAVQDCLVNATSFAHLPDGFNSLDFFWTFMSDGKMNMMECTDSPEARDYYTKMIGGVVATNGGISFKPKRVPQADVDFGPYMSDLQKRIKSAWLPPKGCESKRVVVVFKVHRGGELSNQRIDHSSGVAVADQAALKALENAAPFRPLPAGSSENVDIQFTFDYNVFNGGSHGTVRTF